MFILDLSPTYEWPVSFLMANEQGGTKSTRGFDAVFKRLSTEQIEATFKEAAVKAHGDAWVAKQLLAGWKGVCGPDQAELPFTDSNLARVLAVPGVAPAVCDAFWASVKPAAEKN